MAFQDFINNLKSQSETLFARVKDKGQMKRIVAACCLMTWADGVAKKAEKESTMGILRMKFPQFDVGDIIKAWDEAEKPLNFGYDFGEPEILKVLKPAAKNPEQADLIVRTVLVVANSDDDFADEEKNVARKIIRELGLSAANYDL